MHKLVFGCGYLGARVARLWRLAGHQVHVVTRGADRAAEFSAQGFRPIVADIGRPETLIGLPLADTVLFSVGYDRSSSQSIGEVYERGLQNVLAALPKETNRIVSISSTGVYGPGDGAEVDEDSPCSPTRAGGVASLAAEAALRANPLGARATILRLAGIYGPGRIPRAADLLAGAAIDVDPDSWLNLIHVDDAARMVLAIEDLPVASRGFVVSDGAPVRRGDYYGELARILSAPQPKFVAPSGDATSRGRTGGDKRVRIDRLRREVDFKWLYPTYREGLATIVRG